MADPDRSEQVPGPRKSLRTYARDGRISDTMRRNRHPSQGRACGTYARGGRISDVMRLLERNEAEFESRLVWRLVMTGIGIAVVVVAMLRFLSR